MPRGDGTGPTGVGGGRGQGRGGGRPGGKGGAGMVGSAGACGCPQCGRKEAHEGGVPCFERECPKCSTKMTRQ
jgi:hypothetical protein